MVDLPYKIYNKLRKTVAGGPKLPTFTEMRVNSAEKENLIQSAKTDLARIFYSHNGRVAHKWLHYLDVYERYLRPYRGTAVRMLEIGVSQGGSLEIWRKYLGPEAIIFGVDIDPACADRFDPPNQVRIGSQADGVFLRNVAHEMGGLDIVLDDGSHNARHQAASFDALFPLLPEGGVYIIEDMHTSYWPGQYEGGLKRRGTAVELVKEMIDDMHRWYHVQRRQSHGPIGGIHIYDSMVVIEKNTLPPPHHIYVPTLPPKPTGS